jgi:hypothetical protein
MPKRRSGGVNPSHILTVTNLSGEEAKKIIVKAIEKAGGR